ncbi:hypothetical protein HPB52_021178 [Rhipicephalus sanguineus]|uniref:Uncharacterized protein n=1 Tax=Rhipicephalus sanguineus TaxID=34632 RepID=A0A9D4PDZ1_RHISA|nr:hypothetical protein HPB52_021178 [Rhipicephalus sanguineus]
MASRRTSSLVGGDESESVKESSCSLALPGNSSSFVAKSHRPKDIIKQLQERVCKYKKTIERLRKRQKLIMPNIAMKLPAEYLFSVHY